MMSGVREAAEEDPRAVASDVEEPNLACPPLLRLCREEVPPCFGKGGVVTKECEAVLQWWQGRPLRGDAEHVPHPGVLGHALMDHVFERGSGPRSWSESKISVAERGPDAECLQPFGVVRGNEEGAWVHGHPPQPSIL